MTYKPYIIGMPLLICTIAFSAQASFTFAPPRDPAPAPSKATEIDTNTSTQLSVINSLEKKITLSVSPWIVDRAHSIDTMRKDLAKNYQAKTKTYTSKTFYYYFYSMLGFVFNYGYIFYGLLAAIILMILRVILLRLNFI